MSVLRGIDALSASLRLVATVGLRWHASRPRGGHRRARPMRSERGRRAPSSSRSEPHPDEVNIRGSGPPLLCISVSDRAHRRRRADLVVVQRFDRAFSQQSAEAFLDQLARGRDLAGLVMNAESALGHGRAGTIERVRADASERHFRLVEARSREAGGSRVSSSRARALVEVGRLAEARRLLGRRYAVVGEVVHGDGRGWEPGLSDGQSGVRDTGRAAAQRGLCGARWLGRGRAAASLPKRGRGRLCWASA